VFFKYDIVSEISKFHRFKDNGSASEEEDTKEQKNVVTTDKIEIMAEKEPEESITETKSQNETAESLQENGSNQEGDGNDDDDDILLMADLEEENSLDRLMNEMEEEMDDETKSSEKKKLNKNKAKDTGKTDEDKNFDQKTKSDESSKKEKHNATTLSLSTIKVDRKSNSPHMTNRVNQKRKSLSPRSRPRKKSPRRSPRRSPIRQLKKSPRESRYRSPRRSPLSRYSPRPRSPRPSPRRSPNRIAIKRSPLRRLSPRGRSPKLSSRSRSPRPPHRSRSPRRSPRSKSPRLRSPKMCSRSPRLSRSRSPRYLSPLRSPRSKSPRLSPRRSLPPRRLRSRSRSPAASPLRRGSPRLRSPKGSPRRTPSRLRSPRLSPRRSPWSSPKHSPRLSPRRRRSPKWSPKDSRKYGRSISPDNRGYARDPSPIFKDTAMSELPRGKVKQKDEVYERPITMIETAKESVETVNDAILEARRKKFESTRPIDPVNANKKIKLYKKHTTSTKVESTETTDIQLSGTKKLNKTIEEYNVQELLKASYEFENFEEAVKDTLPSAISDSVNTCIDVDLQKTEKEKSMKKKRKRDKELYQVGKMKSELPLSERIGKDKKCKKRKEMASEDDVDTIFEDMTIDEEGDLRTELSRRRAERLNRTVPIQSARLVQSAFKGVVNE